MKNDYNNYFRRFGYNCFGPILYNFSKWLIDDLKKKDIKKVYFLARDGMMMKKAFDLVNINTDITSYYLYASRRAIIVPSLWKVEKITDILNKITFNNTTKVKYFLKKVGLEEYNLTEILSKHNLNYETIIDIKNIENNHDFIEFFNEIISQIKNNSFSEFKSLIRYFKKMNFEGKVAVVDIGWHGTMQKAICEVIKNAEVNGYYMGVVPYKKNETINQNGFLFDKGYNEEIYEKFKNFTGIFEFMFLATEGSTKRYLDNKKGYELYKYEYENMDELIVAKEIQNGAIKYIKESDKKYNKYSYKNILKVLLSPSLKDAKLFGNIEFQDESKEYLAKPQKLYKYILNPRKFVKDYKNANWRIGFLKRLFKIPFPYYYLNEIIRKLYFRKER